MVCIITTSIATITGEATGTSTLTIDDFRMAADHLDKRGGITEVPALTGTPNTGILPQKPSYYGFFPSDAALSFREQLGTDLTEFQYLYPVNDPYKDHKIGIVDKVSLIKDPGALIRFAGGAEKLTLNPKISAACTQV